MAIFMHGLTPEHYARELLHSLDIDIVPTPVNLICKKLSINLIFTDEIDAEALFVRSGNKTHIVIKDSSQQYLTRQTFSVAHELGHFSLPGHRDKYNCSFEDLNTYSESKEHERDANLFASELLLPTKYFTVDVKRTSLTFKTIVSLAEKYETSLTATALKYIKNTEDCGALICSQNNSISWSMKSSSFQYDLLSGSVSKNSYASDFFTKNQTLKAEAHEVRYDAWISTPIYNQDIKVIEETISMPNLNQTLTLIYIEGEENDEWE